jgi:hypothetical protein
VCFVYYESRKREVKRRLINEGRCDERLKAKVEESTCLTYTGLHDKTPKGSLQRERGKREIERERTGEEWEHARFAECTIPFSNYDHVVTQLVTCNRSVDDKLVYPHPIAVSVGIFSSVQQKFFVFPLFTTGDVTRRTDFEGTNSGQSVFL